MYSRDLPLLQQPSSNFFSSLIFVNSFSVNSPNPSLTELQLGFIPSQLTFLIILDGQDASPKCQLTPISRICSKDWICKKCFCASPWIVEHEPCQYQKTWLVKNFSEKKRARSGAKLTCLRKRDEVARLVQETETWGIWLGKGEAQIWCLILLGQFDFGLLVTNGL